MLKGGVFHSAECELLVAYRVWTVSGRLDFFRSLKAGYPSQHPSTSSLRQAPFDRLRMNEHLSVRPEPVEGSLSKDGIPYSFYAPRGGEWYPQRFNFLETKMETKMDPKTYESVTDKSLWKRILIMLILGFAFGIAKFVLFATVVLQVLFTLFTGSNNEPLKTTGKTLTKYIHEIFMFLTFNSEEKPFPFKAW